MEGFDRIDGDGSSDRDLFESPEQRLPIVEDLLSVRYELRIGFLRPLGTEDAICRRPYAFDGGTRYGLHQREVQHHHLPETAIHEPEHPIQAGDLGRSRSDDVLRFAGAIPIEREFMRLEIEIASIRRVFQLSRQMSYEVGFVHGMLSNILFNRLLLFLFY